MHSRDTALRAASVRGKDKNSLGWQQSGFAANCGLFVTAACQDEEPGTATRIRGADPGAKLSVGLGYEYKLTAQISSPSPARCAAAARTQTPLSSPGQKHPATPLYSPGTLQSHLASLI